MTFIWILLAGVIIVFLWGWFSSNLLLKNEYSLLTFAPPQFGLAYETVHFKTEDGVDIRGWFVAAQGSTETIIICHGWGANRSDVLPTTCFLNQKGKYNLLYFDFRNHGESGGKVTSLITLEARDLEAALRFLKENKKEQAQKIAFFGMSMGAAVCITVASRHKEVVGVVAESPYSSLKDAVVRFGRLFYHTPRYPGIPIMLAFTRWRLGFDPEPDSPIYHVAGIAPRPLLLIQGDRDLRMPVSEGNALFAAAKEPKELWTVPGADHGEVAEKAGAAYPEKNLAFFRKAFA